MQMICPPELNNEISLPVYVTGVGVNDLQLPCSCSSERLFFVAEGQSSITVNGQKYALAKNSLCFLGKNISAMPEITDGGLRLHWLSFSGTASSCPALFTKDDIAVFLASDPSGVSSLFRSIYDTISMDHTYGGYTSSALLYQLLIKLNRDAVNISGGREKLNPAISNALNYISENYAGTITLDKLCEAAGGLSEQYLCRLFKQNTGMRPMEYILKKRISAARSYLENTDMPISDIAVLTGFNNTSYFYRNFKKFTGMSPLVCRQNAFRKTSDA